MREWPASVTHLPRPEQQSGSAPGFGADELAKAAQGVLLRASLRPIRGAAVDSRTLREHAAFFALPGERTDGHRFVEDAVAAGAAAVVITQPLPDESLDRLSRGHAGGVTVIRVPDGVTALGRMASAWRQRFSPLVVGVTGSLAKTSTKEQIAEVLASRHSVLRSAGNENNEIGLPLTLLRLEASHDAAVLEMGMYVPGDIAYLSGLARPAIGVVTAVRGTHISRAGSLEAIERGKVELVEAIDADGAVVLNVDDPRVAGMARRARGDILLYGFGNRADFRAEDVRSRGEEGMSFRLQTPAGGVEVESPALGRHGVHNALAAAAVGLRAGLDPAQIAVGLARPWHAPHRSRLVRAGSWRIVDDSYNASPDSMVAALDLLASLSGRRVAVLGEMLELGEASEALHRTVGAHAAVTADLLITVGEGAAPIADGAAAAGMQTGARASATDRTEALALLLERLAPDDIVLVKASRGAALDWIVDRLVAAHDGEPA